MTVYYIDTSAAMKLLVEEDDSKAMAAFYDTTGFSFWASSALIRIEVMRAVTRATPAALPDARDLLAAFELISIDDEIVEVAMNEPDRMLRSLDAIHLASARILGPDLGGLITYDDRLAAAAMDAGIDVITPRDS